MPTVLKEKVADILKRETQFTIANWLTRVNAEPDVINVPLTAEERCAHLPKMFRDLVSCGGETNNNHRQKFESRWVARRTCGKTSPHTRCL
jgi:hypothetical protein